MASGTTACYPDPHNGQLSLARVLRRSSKSSTRRWSRHASASARSPPTRGRTSGQLVEKLYVFARHLRRLLPADRDEPPREVRDNIDMESFRIQQTDAGP